MIWMSEVNTVLWDENQLNCGLHCHVCINISGNYCTWGYTSFYPYPHDIGTLLTCHHVPATNNTNQETNKINKIKIQYYNHNYCKNVASPTLQSVYTDFEIICIERSKVDIL